MSFLRSLYESENYINENIDLNYTMNTYRSIMESIEVVGNPFVFDARMVPVIKDSVDNEKFSYMIPLEDIIRFTQSSGVTSYAEAVEQIITVNNEACGKEEQCMNKKNTKVVVTDNCDPDKLESACKSDPAKMKDKVKKVQEFTNIVNQIMEAGFTVVKNY